MEGTIAPEQIIINGQEYSPEDATSLIELGSKYKKIESDLNTSLDKVYPEYTRTTQQNKALQQQLAEKDAELEKLRTNREAIERRANTPDDVQEARAAARKLGLADEDFLKEQGYMTKAELDKYFNQKQSEQKQVEEVLSQAAALENKIDGSDGRVPFDRKAVLAYANTYGIQDLTDAYDQMNEKANAKWKAAALEKEERPGLTTLKPGGKKSPPAPKYDDNNIGQALSEWLNGIPE